MGVSTLLELYAIKNKAVLKLMKANFHFFFIFFYESNFWVMFLMQDEHVQDSGKGRSST